MPDIAWNVCMRRASPLAINDFMEVFWIFCICRLHDLDIAFYKRDIIRKLNVKSFILTVSNNPVGLTKQIIYLDLTKNDSF